MTNRKYFKKSIGLLFNAAGYELRGNCWTRLNSEVVVVVNLDKSPYDDQHYLEVGFWLTALGCYEGQKPPKCHLRFSLESLFAENRILILDATILPNTGGDLSVSERFLSFMKNGAIPFLLTCDQFSNLLQHYRGGRFHDGLIRKEAKVLLNESR